MKTPEGFKHATEEVIQNAIAKAAWTLVLNADESARTAHLVELLDDDSVQAALTRFKCFVISSDSEAASSLDIHDASSLSVFVESDAPEYSFVLEYPAETDVDDLLQFLEDTTFAIESGEESQDFED